MDRKVLVGRLLLLLSLLHTHRIVLLTVTIWSLAVNCVEQISLNGHEWMDGWNGTTLNLENGAILEQHWPLVSEARRR